MSAPFFPEGDLGLLAALLLGVCFGFLLERGGLGNPHKLTGIFYLRDFAVPRVMFTAIVVASVGLYLLSDLELLDIGQVSIVPTFFWPQIVGGLIFGAGFVVSGYCPGTALAGLALTAMEMSAERGLEHARDHRGTAGRTDGAGHNRVDEADAFLGHLI